MLEKIFKTAIILTLSMSLFSCKKDKEEKPSYNEENFLETYLTATRFNESPTDFINKGDYEFGLEFTPIVKGKITSLHVKLPDVNTAVRITIWDKVAGLVLRTETVNIPTPNIFFNFDISDLELTKDKQYSITMNTNDWYERRRTDKKTITYPITAGNIKIDNYIWSSGTTQTYPSKIDNSYYAGDLSFSFLQMD